MVVDNVDIEEVNWGSALVEGAMDGFSYGYGRYKINKTIKNGKMDLDEHLKNNLLKSEREISNIRSDLAYNYPKKRRNGKSYGRKITKLNRLKDEKKIMEKEWIKVLLNKEVDGFLSKNTFKKWGRNFIMSIANGEQALFNIIDDLVNKGKIDVEDIKECFN